MRKSIQQIINSHSKTLIFMTGRAFFEMGSCPLLLHLLLALVGLGWGASSPTISPACTGGSLNISDCGGWSVFDIFFQILLTFPSAALVDIYFATNGQQWLNNANWMDGDPCLNSWFGVTCHEGSNATRLCGCELYFFSFPLKYLSSKGTVFQWAERNDPFLPWEFRQHENNVRRSNYLRS